MKNIINPRKALAMEVINFAQFAQKNDLELVQQKLSATSEELTQTKQNLYATSEDLMQTKEQIHANFLGDETIKAFVTDLAQKEVAEYKTIRSEFDGLGVRVTDLESNLAVQEAINEDLALNGYLTPLVASSAPTSRQVTLSEMGRVNFATDFGGKPVAISKTSTGEIYRVVQFGEQVDIATPTGTLFVSYNHLGLDIMNGGYGVNLTLTAK